LRLRLLQYMGIRNGQQSGAATVREQHDIAGGPRTGSAPKVGLRRDISVWGSFMWGYADVGADIYAALGIVVARRGGRGGRLVRPSPAQTFKRKRRNAARENDPATRAW